jgi:isoquinoline 1-oxidoreductase beta subunit
VVKDDRLHLPRNLIDHAMRNPYVPAGFWRGVNLNQNAIYLNHS